MNQTTELFQITYTVNVAGIITSVSEPAWSHFAGANDSSLRPESVVGRPLQQFIAGEETFASYRGFHEALLNGRLAEVAIHCQCDGANVRRASLLVVRVERDAPEPLLRYTASILSEVERSPVSLLDAVGGEAVVRICSYCRRVRALSWPTGLWVTAEAYEASGGLADVQLSHGICRECRERVIDPILRGMQGGGGPHGVE